MSMWATTDPIDIFVEIIINYWLQPIYGVVGIRTYAAFDTAWFGSTAQVTFGGGDILSN